MSLDETNLAILSNSGTDIQRKRAKRIVPIRKNGHLLLTTLLLTNTVINETLPVLFDSIFGGGFIAVIASTVLLVIFSEIIPQAVCSRHGLAIGSFFAWPVRILIYALFIVAWPIAKVLDLLLGSQHGVLYRSAELKELIALHATTQEKGGDLQTDAVTILQGALDLQEKSVVHAMTHIKDVFMLSINTTLDRKTMTRIMKSGHSRIPIFDGPADQPLDQRNFLGVLLVKSLILLDPDDNTPLKDVKLTTMTQISPKMSLFELLNVFQEGGSHMATVVDSDADSIVSDGSNSSIVPSSKKKHRDRRASESTTASSSSGNSFHLFKRNRKSRKSDVEKDIEAGNNVPDIVVDHAKSEDDDSKAMEAKSLKTFSTFPTTTPSVKVPATTKLVGIITLEDVLEELIQEEIYDETDVRKLASLTAMRADTNAGDRLIVASHKIVPNTTCNNTNMKKGMWKKQRRLSTDTFRSLNDVEHRKQALLKEKEMEEESQDDVSELPGNDSATNDSNSRFRLPARSMTDPTGFGIDAENEKKDA
ncbi:hypothetical protein INT44_003211 [Umbelopsis vinacea]|uniref:CNNM transmembrane domain-containing protein n=1 Tax=Umbelopsis vinacea TaxID=44442 RepID=A0A8H7UP81_9FUNG|nr:hypothetical protein INT44_003211 [Umbelopsis vinacea]